MTRTVGLLLFLGFALANACSDAFSSADDCKETRTCDPGEAGAAGVEGMSTSGSNAGGTTGNTDTCKPSSSESCYESPEGKSFGAVPQKAQGACRIGVRTCGSEGKWGGCMGAVAPEPTDSCEPGNDGNCDGVVNDGCPCVDGDSRDCGSDVGDCQKGKQTCSGSVWGACEGEVVAQANDTCDEGNDANCNDSPNNGCECINGAKQPCGTAAGNCEQGEQTCVNGVWAACAGGVVAQASDKCAPAGDDANCNGVPNEGCACTAGATRPCGNCGTQKCGNDGKWEAACSGSGECSPDDLRTQNIACGNCGQQGQKATCTDKCAWGAWTNVGSCLGSGPCQPGVTADQTQNVSCGNCGTQKQTRACNAQCDWPAAWTNSGSCTGQGCDPGSTQAEDAVSCSYCGEQAKQRICDDSCKLGPVVNKDSCVQKECSTMPGDERTGYVICLHPDTTNLVCLPSQKCCTTAAGGFECKGSCDAATEWTNQCDGPEDCTGGKLCCQQYNPNEVSYTTCATSCVSLRRCHADTDCPANWHCSQYASASYHNGVCYPNGSNP